MTDYELAHKRFMYDPSTGILTRKIKTSYNVPDSEVGCIEPSGYRRLSFNGKMVRAHRVIWLMEKGSWPSYIDHIDGDTMNNRINNLRNVSCCQNMQNAKFYKNNTSGCTGVYRRKNCNSWISYIRVDNEQVYLGSFQNFHDAVCARKSAELKYGFHPNHGMLRKPLVDTYPDKIWAHADKERVNEDN